MLGKAARWLAQELARSSLSSAGQQIGEACGKRVAARIYPDPIKKLEAQIAELTKKLEEKNHDR